MSVEANMAIIQRRYQDLNRHDLDAAMTLLAPNFVFYAPGATEVTDASGWRRFFTMYYRAFPDLRFIEDQAFASGNNVALRWTAHGTQLNEFLSVPPTGKQITTLGIALFHIEGDKIAAEWLEFDQLGLVQQLGVILVRGRLASS
ncbi:ester cyclase [Nitrolancea hollandica]|uniref:Ester cyclase n=1 Tax=Nitrolancea hollandica Lb TaxID=1129897 RepID=I4EEI6_9BACT|nr:ester cyclase [Nitrolancea hollandica]CCF83098.1 hypothetical protein NITHO_1840002 [Nitrolancea hollandica Lb]